MILCLREFFATEAAFRSILLMFNLLEEFQRACRFSTYRQPATRAPKCFSVAHCSAARAVAWFCICPLPGAGLNPASRCWKCLLLSRCNFSEVASWASNLNRNSKESR